MDYELKYWEYDVAAYQRWVDFYNKAKDNNCSENLLTKLLHRIEHYVNKYPRYLKMPD